MILGSLARSNLPFLSTPTGTIDRVTSFKLLVLQIDSSLSWANYTTIIIQKASRRLYFLKQLKKTGLATHHLLDFYIAVIRPVLEYCAPVWHYALTKAQTQELETTQKRAIYGRPLSVSGRPCYILPMFLFIYLFFFMAALFSGPG